MKIKTTSDRFSLFLGLAWFFTQSTFAAVQTSDNFDANWPGAPWGATAYSNAANSVSGWSISSNSIAKVAGYFTTPSNACYFARGGLSALRSPFLSNGVGSVIFDARNSTPATPVILALESSYNGSSWFTNSVITNSTITGMAGYTNAISSFSNQYVRIRRIDNNTTTFAIDTIRITYPTPLVTISNLTTSPLRPKDQDPVAASANVYIQSVADTFALTNYWREWPSNNWTLISMSSNAPSLYISDSNTPGKSIGTLIEYYASATYTADGATYTTNSLTNAYVVLPKSSYTNLAITGQVASSLRNGANYQWQGVVQVTNINPTFKFQGISNAFITTWGEVNQAITNIPLYGEAEVTTSNITLYTTNTGYYLFSFTETNLDYSVRSCAYENFDTWTNADTFTPPHTNSAGWILFSGNTSNDSARVFAGTGRSGIVETNGWVQSPFLTNGVGQISFWYRNWQTAGSSAGSFQIQTSSNAINWTILANGSLSNIISTNYLFFSVAASDPVSKYIRILNTNTATRLCLDEVAIVPPGAGVIAANLGTTPASPTIITPISISADLTPYNGAVISNNVTTWYRVGTTGIWETAAMSTTDGVHYVLSAPITGVPTGTLQYAVQYFFSGFQASSPAFFPAGGTNSPTSVSVSMPVDNRQENFDANWPGAPWGAAAYSNVANSASGWSISSNSIAKVVGYFTTPSNACYFAKSGQSALRSPFLSNGVGSVIFDARNSAPVTPVIMALESSYNGSSWFTNSIITNSAITGMAGYTNAISSLSNQYVRIRRIDNNTPTFAIDTVRITYPPANVSITNISITPGYPVVGQAFTASCDVITINPYFPAYNIAPVFSYWTVGGITTSTMIRAWVSGTTNHYTLPVSLGSVTRDTPLRYYVRTFFSGYYGSATENQSPRTSVTNSFIVQAYASTYSNVAANISGTITGGRLLTNSLWQCIINGSSSSSNFSLSGFGYSTGSGFSTNVITFGNSNNWQTTLPLADFAAGTNSIRIGLTNGQYVVRFDEVTGQYIVQRCVWQDFETWAGTGGKYARSINANLPLVVNNFDNWSPNFTHVRLEDFSSIRWDGIIDYTNNAAGGGSGYAIYGSRMSGESVQTTNAPITELGKRFVVQASLEGSEAGGPLRGIGNISYQFRANSVAPPITNSVYIYTNSFIDYTLFQYWKALTNPIISSNTSFNTLTIDLNTNVTMPVIFSHNGGDQNMYFDNISVGEWYADNQTNAGWTTVEGYVEARQGAASPTNYCCRFEASRDDGSIGQYLVTPLLSNGVNTISFSYCGTTVSPATSFAVDMKFGFSGIWSNIDTVSVNFDNSSASNYLSYSKTLLLSASNVYLRVRNTTPVPGALLLDDFKISGASLGQTWTVNNVAIDDTDPSYPPATRQFFGGAGYLNNTNKGTDIATDLIIAPYSNVVPYICTPYIATGGVGEISFWYRNWTTTGVVTPGRIRVQTSSTAQFSTNNSDWTTVYSLTNIVNTNDYQYFQFSIYDTTSHWVRICNDTDSSAGRVCLDDILVVAPMAATLSMSNLVINPTIPLYTDTVHVSVDMYNLFLNPTNIQVYALYATNSSYAGLSNAASSLVPMSCIASNLSSGGGWYRYKTDYPLPALDIDTFVRYSAKATFGGYQAPSHTSPKTNQLFGALPTWYAPMNAVYGTNMAYYVVYSCPTGAVWFNEINCIDVFDGVNASWTNEYIELCGKSGINIKNWTIDVYDANPLLIASYTITNNYIIPTATNNYGFWTLGDSGVKNISMLLTTIVNEYGDSNQNLPFGGGLILKRNWGPIEYKISYCTPLTGYTFVGNDYGVYDASSLGLRGSGTNYGNFFWQEQANFSPSAINNGQILLGQNSPPVVVINSFWVNTNVWISCTRTSGWANTPWYSTNLLTSNAWMNVLVFTNMGNTTNDLLSFQRPTNQATYFYKVVSTNQP